MTMTILKKKKPACVRANSSKGDNPFDVRRNATKQKHQVIGRRVKGTSRNVLAARSEAERKRQKTLGVEYQARTKSNVFKDKRLGEQDPTLSLEEKMMARFQTERKRKIRNASTFALPDSDSEQEDKVPFLTHKGAKLTDDDYEMLNVDGLSDHDDQNSDEGRTMDREIVTTLHFGGGKNDVDARESEDNSGKRKTHKEVMQEVMMKAKLYKAERQKNKHSQENETSKLDERFADLRGLLEFRPTRANGKDMMLKEPMDDFDIMTRELAFEAKAKATERRMSPEEVAAKERDRLAECEKKRVARMHGADVDEFDSDDAGKGKSKKGKKKRKNENASQLIRMPPTDDDLTDNHAVDTRFAANAEEEEVEQNIDDEDDGKERAESEEEDVDADVVADPDHENENEVKTDEKATDEEDTMEENATNDEEVEKQMRVHDAEEAAAELPFVFQCPESSEDLAALFKKHARKSYEKRGLILERIVTYYNPRLSVENQDKMKRFFAVIVRQFLIFASRYAAHKHDLDLLTKTMYTLAQQMSDTAGIVVRELLAQLFKRLHKRATICAWPTLPELLLLKALTRIFPTSDLRHNVVSPMETLLGESLARGMMRSPQEATQALFAASLSLDMTRSKERFMPELVTFFTRILRAFVTSGADESLHKVNDSNTTSIHWLRRDLLEWISTHSGEKISVLPRLSLAGSSSCTGAQVLSSFLILLDISSSQYASLPSFDELFYPLYLLLHGLVHQLEERTLAQVNAVISKLHTRLESCWKTRRPLRLQSFAPSLLPTFTPEFDANYTVRKDKTAPKDKAQVKQLQRQVKRARKSAARELRRDAEFLHREKEKEETTRVALKEAKQKEVRRWLEEQNATFNQQVRKGGHLLKGGGSARERRNGSRTTFK